MRSWLVTGGAGFLGSTFVLLARERGLARIVNLDLLTYAGSPANFAPLADDPDHLFVQGDVRDGDLAARLLGEHRPEAVVHFAAESHVDRSIADPAPFVSTNVGGTQALLEAVRAHLPGLPGHEQDAFRFLQVSTDEVFGDLGPGEPPFDEGSPYRPSSPYAASKAGADHLVRAAARTHGTPVLVAHCSNAYGPRQLPEKLLPLAIRRAAAGEPIPVYGDGGQVRDWVAAGDLCEGLLAVLARGAVGGSWCLGGGAAGPTNLEVVRAVCRELDAALPGGAPHERLVTHVPDRPGHDRRYAMDCAKARRELGWEPRTPLDEGLRRTVRWYLDNPAWVEEAARRAGEAR